MKNQLTKIEHMISYLYKKEKEREKRYAAKKSDSNHISREDVQEVFEIYRARISSTAKLTSVGISAVKKTIKRFSKDEVIAVILKKSKDRFFMEGAKDSGYVANSRRGISWLCGNLTRFNRWLEETDVKSESSWLKQKGEDFLKRHQQ